MQPNNNKLLPTYADLKICLLKDRIRLRQRLTSIKKHHQAGQDVASKIIKLQHDIAASQTIFAKRQATLPTPSFPAELPISARWEEIATHISQHQVIVLCGETGSGKSTQLPKICLTLGRGVAGRIGHTQPRRIAARSLAVRISQELNAPLGTVVGYKVRFQDRVQPETQIKLMTDGMLLAEIQHDRKLYEYDTLILDEAHERSLNIDFLIGYLKQLLPQRTDLKLIITSATIDPQRFSQHFNHAPIIEVSGRTYPVEIRYRPLEDDSLGELDDEMQTAIGEAVDELARESLGDILIFLSGEREILETAATLRKRHLPATEILPLYARLSLKEQSRVFEPHATRHIILATNVAETSLTVPGIRYVIDPGLARISRYSPRSKVQRLPIERVAQAAAAQRTGRCGRVAAGICIRLYSEENFASRRPFTEPEVQRTNLAAVILQMLVLGFGEITTFPFLEAPDARLIADGYRLLLELQAIARPTGGGGSGWGGISVTPLGQKLARLPVDPRLGRMLLAAVESRCVTEVLIIVAALSVQDPRERPLDKRESADLAHATFNHAESDFLTFLNLWRYLEQERALHSKKQLRAWCTQNFLSWTRSIEWQDTHQQLQTLLHEQGVKIDNLPPHSPTGKDGESYDTVHRALLTGLLDHIGLRDEDQSYQGVRGGRFWIHPGSGQFRASPKWIMAAERVQTNKEYGRVVARIRPDWIETAAAHLVTREYSEPHWQAERGHVAAFEKISLHGLVLVHQRRVNYSPINSAEARAVFIRSALVNKDFSTRAPFFRHNQELIAEVERLESKARRRDLLVDDETILAFYEPRIPAGISTTPDFETWLKNASRDQPKLLHMRMSDLLQPEAELVSVEQFPDYLEIGGVQLPLEYRFDPTQVEDGVTLVVPLALINQIPIQRLAWLVPGMLETLITTLLRNLPKEVRKLLVPIPETVVRLMPQLAAAFPSPHLTSPTMREESLLRVLSTTIFAVIGVSIPESTWDVSALPEHLRMGLRIVDDAGKTLDWSRDVAALRRQYGGQGQRAFANIPVTGVERSGLTRWDFGTVPEVLSIKRGGIAVLGFPAIVDQGPSVALRVLDSKESAAIAHRVGLRRLVLLSMPAEARQLRKNLIGLKEMRLLYAKVPTRPSSIATLESKNAQHVVLPELEDELTALILDRAVFANKILPRDAEAFAACLAIGRSQLHSITIETCHWVSELLTRYQKLRLSLAAVTQVLWQPSVADMQAQLDALIFRGFLQIIPNAQLQQYPRYIQALETRLKRLPDAAARDRQRVQELAPLLEKWKSSVDRAYLQGQPDVHLQELRWMMEELRISIFAQPQPTLYPISISRIEQRW